MSDTDKAEKINLASVGLGKDLDSESFRNSDYLYGKSDEFIEDVFEIMSEGREQGLAWFREQYSEYDLHWGVK